MKLEEKVLFFLIGWNLGTLGIYWTNAKKAKAPLDPQTKKPEISFTEANTNESKRFHLKEKEDRSR